MFIGKNKKYIQKELDYWLEEYCPLCNSVIKVKKDSKKCTNENCSWAYDL